MTSPIKYLSHASAASQTDSYEHTVSLKTTLWFYIFKIGTFHKLVLRLLQIIPPYLMIKASIHTQRKCLESRRPESICKMQQTCSEQNQWALSFIAVLN